MDFRNVIFEIIRGCINFLFPVKFLEFFLFWVQFFLQYCDSFFAHHFDFFEFTADCCQELVVLFLFILKLWFILNLRVFGAHQVMDRLYLELSWVVDNLCVQDFSVLVWSEIPYLHKMMHEIAHNNPFDWLANIVPGQSRMSLINVVDRKFPYIINVFNPTVVVFDSRIQISRACGKYFMLVAVISTIAQIKSSKECFFFVDDNHFGMMRP